MNTLEQEAKIFTHYIVHRDASPQAIRLYDAAMTNSSPNKTDKKLLNFMRAHPHSVGLIDAGLVFNNPESEARRRLYVMLAILEASPEHTDLFLPKKRSPFYVIFVLYSCTRAVLKAVIGLILVKAVA